MSRLSNCIATAFFAFIAIVAVLGPTQARAEPPVDPQPAHWVTGYYVAYQRDLLTPDEIDWNGLTHIIMARVLANADGTLNTNFDWDPTNGPALARDVASRAHAHGKKAILMLGGDDNGVAIRAAVADHRAAFIANLVAAMSDLGYDGIDLDWENNIDWDLFKLFAAELRQAAPQAILTLPGGPLNMNYDTVEPRLVEVITHIDQFNLMSYYPATAWAGSGWLSWHNSPLSGAKPATPVSIEDSFNRYVTAGIPRRKLGMGVGFYVTCYTGNITEPNQSTESGVQILGGDNEYPLSEIYSANGAYDESMRSWDSAAQQPYLSLTQAERHGCRYVSIEDEESLIAKGTFTRDNGYGGIIIWTMNQGQVRSHATPNFLFEALRKGFIEPDLVRNVGISVMQGDLWLERSATQRFSALVTGTTDKRVQWSVTTPNCGSIDATTGLYSAPSIDSNCTIQATSLVDTNEHATAQITVINATWAPKISLSRLGTHWLEVTAMDADVVSMSVGLGDGSSFALTLQGRAYGTNYPIFVTNYAFPESGGDYTFYAQSKNNRKASAVLHVPRCVHGDDGLCRTLTTQSIGTISFNPATLKVAGTTVVSATAGSGLAVTFSSTTPTICSVSGNNVTGLLAGTCTVAVNQSGNASFAAAPQVTLNITVSQNSQTIGPISFTPATLAVGGATTANATATSGLVVTFSSITPTRCAVSGATVIALETGTCTIAVNQAGDASFAAAAQVTKDISITQANVTDLIDLSDVTQIDAGSQYTCAVTAAGGVKCWGLNSHGQLGDGTKSSRGTATNVTGLTSGVVAVSVGRGSSEVSHTCALTTSGAVKCWGANESGQLGDGTTVERLTPVDVVGLGGGVAAVSSGGQHTCAVMIGGDVKCWGDNTLGQLGDGTQVQRLTPVSVVGLNAPILAISTSFKHSCAISNVGGAFCWGSNVSGELGDGTTVSRSTPIGVSSLENGTQTISAGGVPYNVYWQGGLQTCAVTAAGGVKCWGENQVGGHLTPYEVSGLTSGIASVSTGALGGYYSFGTLAWVESHACALKTNGNVACWGGNSGGQLSCTTTANPVSPVEVSGINSPSKQVSAGGSHTCALSVGGLVECWGGKEGSIRGSAIDPPACQPRSVTVTASGLTVQQIAFSGPTSVPIAGSAEIMATGGDSGNPVIFTSVTPSTCSITGSAVSGLTGGLCIVAGNQLGNDVYEPAVQVLHKLRVGDPIAQVIAFGDIPPIAVGGTGKLVASASSGLPVTFSSNTPSICAVSGDTVSGLATGICTIAADQMGDQVYARATQTTKDISVSKTVDQSISFGVAPSVSVGGTGTVSATATSGLAVSFSSSTERYCTVAGSIVTGVSVGTCTIVADQAGNATYAPAPQVTQNITIQPAVVASPHRLLNLATRGKVETVDNVMIAGFIIQGSSAKKVLIRARGPSLATAPFNVPGTLSDPFLTLYSGATPIDSNDDFALHANAAQIPAD
ncbi:MAG: hypothetical protein KBF66_15875, partial [Rhodoferax sp.]|uniref:glycosyl hydrolase family 18 protein n=1 Tax=Rhodoferax sp. TaxID=50421 RepID=UPI001B6F08D9